MIWSGATFSQRTACDFKVVSWNDSEYLSYVLLGDPKLGDPADQVEPEGVGLILDSSYSTHAKVHPANNTKFNMHEFKIIEHGRSALIITGRFKLHVGQGSDESVIVWECSAQEIEVETGKVVFNWNSLDYVTPSESFHEQPSLLDSEKRPWDYL